MCPGRDGEVSPSILLCPIHTHPWETVCEWVRDIKTEGKCPQEWCDVMNWFVNWRNCNLPCNLLWFIHLVSLSLLHRSHVTWWVTVHTNGAHLTHTIWHGRPLLSMGMATGKEYTYWHTACCYGQRLEMYILLNQHLTYPPACSVRWMGGRISLFTHSELFAISTESRPRLQEMKSQQ